MCDQNRFCRLQMRVSRHGAVARGFGACEHCFDPIGNQVLQDVDAVTHEEAKISCNLFVAAASGVELVAGRADQRGELFFDEVVDVFGFRIVQKLGRRFRSAPDFFQRLHNFGKLSHGKHSRMLERVGVGAAGGEFEGQ
jgi:hypothetical protein